MGGVLWLGRLHRGGQDRFSGPVRPDAGADFAGIFFIGQMIDRILDEIRIAQGRIAVRIGGAHGLGHHMHRLGRARAEFGQRIAFQHIEDLAHHHAARAGRRG